MKTEEPIWISLGLINFDETITYLRFDTRDFNAVVNCEDVYEPSNEFQLTEVNKKDKIFFTLEETRTIIHNLYRRSGGEGSWRYLSFKGKGIGLGWLKYFSVFKTKHGYIFKCRKEERCLYEYELLSEIDSENLNKW